MNRRDGIGTTQRRVDPTVASAASNLSGAGRTQMNTLPTGARSASGRASQADEVDLSTTMCAVARALSGTDVRAERIAALRQSIAAGTYHVSSPDIAGKLINALLEVAHLTERETLGGMGFLRPRRG
jgi:negative regulator of flagellin synthesis FlgM